MTKEECIAAIKKLDRECIDEVQQIRKKFARKKKLTLNFWAYNNARFNIGDIIECQGKVIQVDKITADYGNTYIGELLYCTYQGVTLTKQLKPRKDGERTSFYDDGREIKKIR